MFRSKIVIVFWRLFTVFCLQEILHQKRSSLCNTDNYLYCLFEDASPSLNFKSQVTAENTFTHKTLTLYQNLFAALPVALRIVVPPFLRPGSYSNHLIMTGPTFYLHASNNVKSVRLKRLFPLTVVFHWSLYGDPNSL